MIPAVDDASLYKYLGDCSSRAVDRAAILAAERADLGLPPASAAENKQRLLSQTAAAERLAKPWARRTVQRRAVDDVLDLKIAQRKRNGPLPVDEELAEEHLIIQQQLLRLRQTGTHLLGGGDASSGSFSMTGASASFGDGMPDATFLTGVMTTTPPQRPASSSSGSRGGSAKRRGQNNAAAAVYAGDILFRPGRAMANLAPEEFWLYERQKVTQRTLGTEVLQHPCVVGGAAATEESAQSLKQLLMKSPIFETIKRKVAALLARTTTRTRCGILFDLLSTRNIIVSGIPAVVGAIVYEHIHDEIRRCNDESRARSLKFVFVGVTDNSNCCAARDVFCADKVLGGKDISATKRTLALDNNNKRALDNVHIFAVPPPGGEEPLLGPAVDKSGMTRSSPLGMRPWHAAMRKKKHVLADPLAPLVRREAGALDSGTHLDDNSDDDGGEGDAAPPQQPPLSAADVRAAFDPRDWQYLPNVSNVSRASNVERWEQAEMANLRSVITGPTVALHRMSKRYNSESSSMMKRMDLATVLSGVNAARNAMLRSGSSRTPQPWQRHNGSNVATSNSRTPQLSSSSAMRSATPAPTGELPRLRR